VNHHGFSTSDCEYFAVDARLGIVWHVWVRTRITMTGVGMERYRRSIEGSHLCSRWIIFAPGPSGRKYEWLQFQAPARISRRSSRFTLEGAAHWHASILSLDSRRGPYVGASDCCGPAYEIWATALPALFFGVQHKCEIERDCGKRVELAMISCDG